MSGYASSPNSSTAQPSRSRPPATARLLQHEYDHLDGILYPQGMTDITELAFNSEMGDHFYLPRDPALFVE